MKLARLLLECDLKKAMEEGGTVIGKTGSGKSVYHNYDHPDHDDFDQNDHFDAAKAHTQKAHEYRKKMLGLNVNDKNAALHKLLQDKHHHHIKNANKHLSGGGVEDQWESIAYHE